jgi:hypothetical protein
MDAGAWDDLAAAHAALSALQARSSDSISDLLDLLTRQAAHHPDLLSRVVRLRTEAAELSGDMDDALADLEHAIEALAPPDSDAPA